MALPKKTCVTCGNLFQPYSNRHLYCSEQCKRGLCVCKGCGKQFVPKGKTTGQWCSKKCWYEWPGRIQDRDCPVCGKTFRPKYSRQKTCGYGCADKSRRTAKRNTHCAQCGTALRPNVHPRVRFCSKRCAMLERDRRGLLHKPEGSVGKHVSGYLVVKIGKKWMLQHRHVMEQMLGRPLSAHERVHHKNGKRDDNRPENLELWTVLKKDPAGQRVSDIVADILDQPEFQGVPARIRKRLAIAITRALAK